MHLKPIHLKKASLSAATLCAAFFSAAPAQAQTSERLLGEIFMTGANFCPRGSAEADGKLLPIKDNTALFSLLGTTYGGDGRYTFGLPDLRGRAPFGAGRGPGLPDHYQGTKLVPKASDGQGTSAYGLLAIRYCVVTVGIFPSRS